MSGRKVARDLRPFRDARGENQRGTGTCAEGVWMMPQVIITPGVTVGDYSVIATGSVLIDDIPPMVMAAGVPAQPKKDLR